MENVTAYSLSPGSYRNRSCAGATERGISMTVNQIARYTALVKRRSELLLCSGSWKPDYEKELQGIDMELAGTRKEMEYDEAVL